MDIIKQIILDLHARRSVELSNLGKLKLDIIPARLDKENGKFIPPKQKIIFISERKEWKNIYTGLAEQWEKELLENGEVIVENLGKWTYVENEILFFPEDNILQDSFYGFEEISISAYSNDENSRDIKKNIRKKKRLYVWIAILILIIAAIILYLDLAPKDNFFERTIEEIFS